jgi:enoyl-CoA hydratase
MASPAAAPEVSGEPETRIERRGRAGFIVLDRPRALNALTLTMVRAMARALDEFEADPAVERVVVVGAGGRAFCAGGDIRWLYERGRRGDHESQLAFWREEYTLNQRIKRFSKPYVALIDGIVMGGGVGISLHGSHRVATERCIFAMPEVGIGFFPDVGATWILPRLPHRIGVYLAVTGLRADAGDVVALGLATSFTPSERLPALERALESEAGPADALLARHAAMPPASPLIAEAALIEAAFAWPDPAAIQAALEQAAGRGSEFAARALAALARKSPTSQAIALRQMRIGASMTFEDAMATEFRIVSRICRGHDFYEGVRATIIDKDDRAVWRPAPGEPVAATDIDAYFAPLGESELVFSGSKP